MEMQIVVTVIYSRQPLDGADLTREALECYTGVISELVGGTSIVCWESHNIAPPEGDTGQKASMFIVTIYHDDEPDAAVECVLTEALSDYQQAGHMPDSITAWDIQETVPLLTLPPAERPPVEEVVSVGSMKDEPLF